MRMVDRLAVQWVPPTLMRACAVRALVLCAVAAAAPVQLLPPPRDGEIRAVYWELRDLTELSLTLEPQSAQHEKLPILLTLIARFPGKRPSAPLAEVELRADVGRLWSPVPELTVILDDLESLDLRTSNLLDVDGTLRSVAAPIAIDAFKRMTRARKISGKALRLQFVLTEHQRGAIETFAKRVLPGDTRYSERSAAAGSTRAARRAGT